jgi:hypothetical protein
MTDFKCKPLHVVVIIPDFLVFDTINNEMAHLPFDNVADFIDEFLRVVFEIL